MLFNITLNIVYDRYSSADYWQDERTYSTTWEIC